MSVSNLLSPPAVINRFLYASVGDDNNGMDLTLLSALARQNVDAWQKAAELSLLPGALAIPMLAALLISVPGHESLLERTALADRLIVLLQHPVQGRGIGADSASPDAAPQRSETTNALTLILIYFIGMVICGWFLADPMPPQSAAKGVAASTTVAPGAQHHIARSQNTPQNYED
jgi:hypothetical protein